MRSLVHFVRAANRRRRFKRVELNKRLVAYGVIGGSWKTPR